MQKIICTCCGLEISKADRFCPNCAENNDAYEEAVATVATVSLYPNQSINKVSLKPAPVKNNQEIQKSNIPNNSNISRLAEFQIIFDLIETLKDSRIKEYTTKMEEKYNEKDELFYFYCGKFLERILKKIKYTKTPATDRQRMSYEDFCSELETKFWLNNIDYEFLKSKNIYTDWIRKFGKKDGTEFSSFKADLTDILLRTDLIDSPLMYSSFIDDVFKLYSLRSSVNHDDDNSINMNVDLDKIKTLVRVTKVLFELI